MIEIDLAHFTPIASLAGGALIGLAAALLITFNGRVSGISGILGGLLSPTADDRGWRLAFVVGLMTGPLLVTALQGRAPDMVYDAPAGVLVVAGVVVGFGSRLGGGCTSGHGVCGLARLSPRSLVATGCFMAAAMVTTYVMRHLVGG